VADRFDVIEVGQSGRRRWVGLVVVVAVVLVPIVGLIVSREPVPQPAERAIPAPVRSLTRIDSPPNVLQVTPVTRGDDEVIEVVFPDGVGAEVRYPAELGLARMGSRPFQGLWVDGIHRQVMAPYNGEIEVTRGGQPIRSYAPNVTLWPRQAGSGSFGQVLLFSFGKWRLAMHERGQGLTFDQRLAVARDLKGRVTADGYLVLSARGETVRLAEPGEAEDYGPAGPQLWFGGGVRMVMLVPTPACGKRSRVPFSVEERGRPVDAVCRDGVQIAVMGPERFREAAIQGIRVTVKD
jgi:hypothetical protein